MSNLADLAAATAGLNAQVERVVARFGKPAPGLKPWTKLSTGLPGPIKVGFNFQAWSWAGSLGTMMTGIGARVLRLPCSNATTLATTQAALDAGLDVVCKIYLQDLPALRSVVNTFGVKYGPRVTIECGNEPQFISGNPTAQQVYDYTAAMYAAVKAISPLTPVSGPVINVSYTGPSIAFTNEIVRLGFRNVVDYGDFHPYLQTPEESFNGTPYGDILPMCARLGKASNIISEVGWSDATLPAVRTIANSDVQDTKTCCDYYSRYIALAGCAAVSHLIFYIIIDQGTDPAQKQHHFGVYTTNGVLKPQGVVAKDAMAKIHQTTQRTCGQRGANWYVRGDTPAGPQLWAWNPAGTLTDAIVVDTPLPATLNIAVAGAPPTVRLLAAGRQTINITLGTRATILWGQGCTFPEFS